MVSRQDGTEHTSSGPVEVPVVCWLLELFRLLLMRLQSIRVYGLIQTSLRPKSIWALSLERLKNRKLSSAITGWVFIRSGQQQFRIRGPLKEAALTGIIVDIPRKLH